MPKRLRYICITMMMFSCAVQGPNLGGDPDTTPPSLLRSVPLSESINFNRTQKVIIYFDEMIDRSSIHSSIEVSNNFGNYKVKVKGSQIILIPNEKWLGNDVLHISLKRSITDYKNNRLDKAVRLIYSFTDNIPKGTISGKLFNVDDEIIYEIMLFDMGNDMSLVDKVQSDANGEYIFEFVPSGKYVVGALEHFFEDDYEVSIRLRDYALGNTDFIGVDEDSKIFGYNLRISDPISRVEIESANFINSNFGYVTFTDGSTDPFFVNQLISIKGIDSDTLIYETTMENGLEEYLVGPLKLVIPSIEDTINPKISSYTDIGDSIEIKLSEPVQILGEDDIFFNTSDSSLGYSYDNKFRLSVDGQNSLIRINNSLIFDYAENMLEDTLLAIDLSKEEDKSKLPYSAYISGTVESDGDYVSMVRATNIDSVKTYFTKSDKENGFIFMGLEPGMYYIDAYEILNEIDEQNYFSGTWSPYNRAAKFSEIIGPVELRSGWDVEDINIRIK